jgi:hypothetical protein
MRTVDINFNSSARPRNRTGQVGSNINRYTPGSGRPSLRKLVEFEQLALYDSAMSFGLFILIDTLISNLGKIEHPDPEIQSFCRESVSRMGGLDSHSSSFYTSLFKMLYTAAWSGFSVTENLFVVENGVTWLDDFITYHPASIIIRPDVKGRLVDNAKGIDTMPSGIYQSTDKGEKHLPLWKCTRITRSEMYGNYYGVSALECAYKWSVLKEAFTDMMAVALDRFGNPIVALTFPLYNSNQTEIDSETGEEKTLTTQELLEKQIANNQFSGGGNVLLLPQLDKDMKPTAQVLTTGNNVGSTFLDAIHNCDREMSRSLFVPYGLMSNDTTVGGELNENQMTLFNSILKSLHTQNIQPIISQSFHRLIKMNYSRTSANIAPTMPLLQSHRPEDRVALMQVISGLTDRGYFNPLQSADWTSVRNMVEMSDRDMTPEDVDFIKKMIVIPKQPAPNSGGAKGNSKNSSRAKGTEGTKNPGGGAGRPVGSSAPKLQ